MRPASPIIPKGWHIGVDEAGRGCLAGPVTAGAVLAPPDFDWSVFPGLTDSKALGEAKRMKLRELIFGAADKGDNSGFYWSVGFAWPEEIDRVNILNATFRAMTRAVCSLLARVSRRTPEGYGQNFFPGGEDFRLYIDGSQSILLPQWQAGQTRAGNTLGAATGIPLPRQCAVVGGDALVPAISAASILAKTQRDMLMRALERRWPGYGFFRHKGYGTKEHMAALRTKGLCPQHRKSFCKNFAPAATDQFSLF